MLPLWRNGAGRPEDTCEFARIVGDGARWEVQKCTIESNVNANVTEWSATIGSVERKVQLQAPLLD